MLRHFLAFELRFWFRGFMLWVFTLIIGAMFFGAASSDQVTVGRALENTFRNAPFVIQNFYAVGAMLTLLMVTAFVNSAAARDFQYNTHQIIFATPMRKRDYLLGRYLGATFVAVIPMLGISLGILLAKYMPWVDAERWGPISWDAHIQSIIVFAIPNTLFISAIIFAIAALTRSTITSFIGALCLMVAYGVAETFISDIDNETIAKLADPFASHTYGLITKYWTVADKNTRVVGLEGMMLLNRVIWLTVGAIVFAFTYSRFRFEERSRKSKKTIEVKETRAVAVQIPTARFSYSFAAQISQFFGQVRIEFLSLVKTTTFIVILLAAMLNCGLALAFSANEGYGVSSLPVTYWILDLIRGTLYLFLVAIITYFAGVLVWRERDARSDEINDALPYPNWIPYVAKFCALAGAIALILVVAMGAGITVQWWNKYTRFQLGLYFTELFVLDFASFLFLSFLAFLIHVLSPNKYIGYFAFIAFMIANAFVWRPLDVATRMVRFPSTPGYTYSDFYLFAPFVSGLFWFHLYWFLFCGMLAVISMLLWPRGKETRIRERWRNARTSFSRPLAVAAVTLGIAWVACAGWIYYNTQVVHKIYSENQGKKRSTDYEKTYKKYEGMNQPRIQAVKYWIDIHPERRDLVFRGEQVLQNKGDQPISEMHINLQREIETELQIDRAAVKNDDTVQNYRIYSLTPPLQPGETINMKYTLKYINRGFEQSVSRRELVQNGTFFNNQIVPQIGYQAGREMTDRNDRRKYGLPEKDLMRDLERNCTKNCGNTYLSNNSDWVSVETILSTSPDQIGVAPGSLLREWQQDGRRYFHYKLDQNSLNFYSFISARYEVAREELPNGVKSEVYYHHEHKWNVKKMQDSIRKTLEYCTRNFGPYLHKQARIIEFPRVASFAQAFPGTMPYSESIGFIANINKPDDIDKVYYVVAHEMGHQWWAHQIIGANMQGATLLSETLAQYTALMVMEHEYGRDTMRKFLSYEMDRYLRARGAERLKERPLLRVEASQGYVHYNKGSVALYYLKEMIGEEAVNKALRKLIADWAYKGPPYPTSYALVDNLREVTPPEFHYLLQDLFDDITLFANRTMIANAKKRPDGKFDVTIEFESRKLKADDKGNEKEVAVNDWMEIGAFAKPPKGKKYGDTLHRQRVHITAAKNKFTFTVEKEPEKAGIDPFSLLVDRIPDDNLKKVTVM